MESLVAFLFRPFVRDSADFQVSAVENTSSVLLEVRASSGDLERLRGPDDVNLRAVQQVLSAAGGSRKPVLDLVDPASAVGEE